MKKRKGRVTLAKLVSTKLELPPEEAEARVMCGEILVDGERIRDPKTMVLREAGVVLSVSRYVSRGGDKLAAALRQWGIPVSGKLWLDAGASTGGFTDCLLQEGAAGVVTVDVGYNQIAYSLRTDPRVLVMERTNIMSLDKTAFPVPPNAAVADLSFRSLRGAAPHILSLVTDSLLVALAKPQFEVGSLNQAFDGVVRDKNLLLESLRSLVRDLWAQGAYTQRVLPSPIRGRSGNVEFLLLLSGVPAVEQRLVMTALEQAAQKAFP